MTVRRSTLLLAIASSLCASLTVASAAPPSRASAPHARFLAPARISTSDIQRRIDVNQINMWVTNFGSFAWNISTGNAGLIFPRGSGKTAVFASGLWLGCEVGGQQRTLVAEYSSEYGPGRMVSGTFDDPSRPQYKVYKVVRFTGDPADTGHVDRTPAELAADPSLDPLAHHSWSEYIAGAAAYGAPTRVYRLPNTTTPDPTDSVDVLGPDVSGDQMLWCVYNDANPALHTNTAGSSLPLGVEVQQSTFAFNQPGPLGNTVFIRYRIINRGSNHLDNLFVSSWSDPDVGNFTDDLEGCDPTRGLGIAFNGLPTDAIYGATPPAVGYDLLRGPLDPVSHQRLGLTAFDRYINGTDPASTTDTYNYMQGLESAGFPIVDPTTGLPTHFMVSGDLVTGTGWLDSNPADRRMLLSSGPFSMAPADSQEITIAVILAQGTDNLTAVGQLKCADDYVQSFFDQGLMPPFPPLSTPCPVVVACPRPSSYWASECAQGGVNLTGAQLTRIAQQVDTLASTFGWTLGTELSNWCATVSSSGDSRAAAKREFATLLANYAAGELHIAPASGLPIYLNPNIPASCPRLRASTLGELMQRSELTLALIDATYLNVGPNGTALFGVNFGLSGFGGAADAAINFLGASTLDPRVAPDSFSTVELRFNHTTTQKAYRFLRLEKASDGGAPPQGRFYTYAGFFDVPFTAWDTVHNQQLDVAFAERALTADDRTLLPLAQQPATFDSTWAPDASPLGGREYLWILSRPYSPTPKPALAHDGMPADGSGPLMWVLCAAKVSPSSTIDDGDKFQFHWGRPPCPGADSLLVDLESQSLSNPLVRQAYDDLTGCLHEFNNGLGVGPTCNDPPPTGVTNATAQAEPGRVRITWYPVEAAIATVYRRTAVSEWTALRNASPDGNGMLVFEDTAVESGTRYGYRLGFAGAGDEIFSEETWIQVPAAATLSIAGLRPNPAGGDLTVWFSLPRRAPATLEFLDLSGRRVLAREVGGLGPGSHALSVGSSQRWNAGVYFIRLTQGGHSVSTKAALLR